tara:strand:+ start:1283 stop:1804 length:522 start_codon:yes stop_codon:yes gene_type:complete
MAGKNGKEPVKYKPGVPKIEPVTVPSDNCVVMTGQVIKDGKVAHPGTPHHIHEGETVTLLPVSSVKERLAITRIAAVGDSEDPLETYQAYGAMDDLAIALSQRVLEWTWTDMFGHPMPQPHNEPEVIRALQDEELIWLMSATVETEEDRGNESTPSLDSSSEEKVKSLSQSRA